MSIAAEVLDLATRRGVTLATAESCTGGLIAARLTDVPGCSGAFHCGFVTYDNQAKIDLLGVRQETLDRVGAVSEEVAREMADGARARSGGALVVSVTGIAGPGGSEHKPEGRVCFGLARADHPTHVETVEFGALGRSAVRGAASDHAFALLLRALS